MPLKPLSETGYKVEWTNPQIPSVMQPGKEYRIGVTIKNIGTDTWSSAGKEAGPVYVAYHWLPAQGDVPVIYEGARSPLPGELGPGKSISIENVLVVAPTNSGSYRLQVSLLQEGVIWFENKGAGTLIAPVSVR
jgi:hypothetical protein